MGRSHGEFEDSYINGDELDKNIRSSDVAWTDDPWLHEIVFAYMHNANARSGWNFDIRSSESFQITRYKVGGFYGFHHDGGSDNPSAYDRPDDILFHGYVRKLSMSILLNEDFDGGEFQFATYKNEKFTVSKPKPALKTKGSILIFPSFLEHRVTAITRGVRYSLVAWTLGPPFK